jgi:hypothetical protein
VSAIQKVGKLPIYRDWQRLGQGKFLRFEKGDDVNPKVTLGNYGTMMMGVA